MDDHHIADLARRILSLYREHGLRIATAESCTGGMIAAALTEVAGSSDVFERGFVTYSNEAKVEMIGVPTALLAFHGAVSEPVARAMAEGALSASKADVAVSVTGIAGPGGGSAQKPVGLVHLAVARRNGLRSHVERRFADLGRHGIRTASVVEAFRLLEEAVGAPARPTR